MDINIDVASLAIVKLTTRASPSAPINDGYSAPLISGMGVELLAGAATLGEDEVTL